MHHHPIRRRLGAWTLLLGLCLALPAAADDGAAALLKKLSDTDTTARVEAAAKLRAMGEKARVALEGFVDPAGPKPAPVAPREEQ